jgi:CheY-like chemotaxis protein
MGPTVLVVDESPYLGDVLMSALEREGCAVAAARTRAQALHLADTLAPDLITIDLGGHGGIDADLVARLIDDPRRRTVPMIVIAPNVRDFPSATRVFGKPFYVSEVVSAVLEILSPDPHHLPTTARPAAPR